MKTKKKLLVALICVFAAAVAVAAVFVVLRLNREPALVISASDVSSSGEYWGQNSLYGYVTTDRMQAIYLSESQTVTEIYVSEGDTVKAGAPLLDYDTSLTDLQLQRKELEIQKQERELEKLQREYKSMFGQTFTLPEPTVAAQNNAQKLSCNSFGAVLHLLSETEITTEQVATEEPVVTEEPVTTEQTEPTETTEPEAPVTAPQMVGGSGTPEDPYLCLVDANGAMDAEYLQALLGADEAVSVVFAQCEGDTPEGTVFSAWGMYIERKESGGSRMRLTDASAYVGLPLIGGSAVPDEPIVPGGGGGMSYEELQKYRAEKEREMIEADLNLRMARVEYKKMQQELGDGTVYAELDGVVLAVGDPETAYLNGEAVLKISGGGGYCIEGTVSELSLDEVMIGRAVSVTSWMNGMTYEGVISAISTVPAANGGWADGNNNVSFYPFTVIIDETAELMDGEYVEMQLAGESEAGSFYLEMPFVLQENGKCYVYAVGEKGRLEKRELVTGRTLWGSYIEVLGGLTMEDRIAFPYGKTVYEGAQVKDGTLDALYGW